MILLSEIMNIADLRAEIAAGSVTLRAHPDDENLRVLCYSRNVQYGGQWTEVVRQCRGLIVYGAIGDEENWQLIERPWKKFFTLHQMGTNWSLGDDEDGTGELALGNVDLHAPAAVTDKLDGSMLVLYPHPQTGEPAFATKGSFTSAQALHFTNLVRGWPLHWLTLRTLLARDDYTFLFEGVGPSNRIVLNYPDDAVILLGAVHKRSGVYFGPELVAGDWEAHGLPVAETLHANSIMEATALADREGKEGVVARVIGQATLVKVKQEDYLAMHRAMFSYGVSAVLGIFRGANLTWSDISAVAEAGSVAVVPRIREAIENVGVPEVIAERMAFLNSVILPQAISATNAAAYASMLPVELFELPKPEIKRGFAQDIEHHQKASGSAAAYLFAALDGRIALYGHTGPSEKLAEVFINTSAKALERAFSAQQQGEDKNV